MVIALDFFVVIMLFYRDDDVGKNYACVRFPRSLAFVYVKFPLVKK